MAVAEAGAIFSSIDDLESRTGAAPSFDAMRQDLRAQLARLAKMGPELRGTVASVPHPTD